MAAQSSNGTITSEQRLTVVKHLAHGRGVEFVATATGIDQQTVRSIGNDHGGCDNPDALTRAAEQLARKGHDEARTAGITERPDLVEDVRQPRISKQETRNKNLVSGRAHTERVSPTQNVGAPERQDASPRGETGHETSGTGHQVSGGERPITQAIGDGSGETPEKTAGRAQSTGQTFDATAALLLRGKDSERKRTQNLAQRIEDQLVDLRDRLDEEDVHRREREQREAAKQEAREEVEELQKQLAEARGKLRSPAKAKRTDAIKNGEPRQPKAPSRSALIRRWAADNGYECPAFGRVPRRICDAYAEAHGEEAGETG